jgi:two-component system response regulator FlrC
MRSIFPSTAIAARKVALLSQLRAQGFGIAAMGDRPAPGDLFLVAEGETPPAPARTVVIGEGLDRYVIPSALPGR